MRTRSAVLCVVLLMCGARCLAEGLDTLVEVGKGQVQIQKAFDEETKAFTRVKEAVEDGDIAKGQAKSEIRKRYGEPVIVTTESGGTREAWVYKSAGGSFFKGVKIYLFFDARDALDEIRVTR